MKNWLLWIFFKCVFRFSRWITSDRSAEWNARAALFESGLSEVEIERGIAYARGGPLPRAEILPCEEKS